MYRVARRSNRPPWMCRRPWVVPESRANGATPTSAAICRRLRRPSSGNSPSSVALEIGPMPLAERSSRSSFAVVSPHMVLHFGFDLVELVLDRRDDGFDAWPHGGARHRQALALIAEHRDQLPAACYQRRQILLLRADERANKAGEIMPSSRHAGQLSEHARVDPIGLGRAPHGFGKITRLPRIDHGDRQSRGLKSADQRYFVAARGLHHHQRHRQILQRRNQRQVTFRIVARGGQRAVAYRLLRRRCGLSLHRYQSTPMVQTWSSHSFLANARLPLWQRL